VSAAVIIFAHGSSVPEANDAVRAMAAEAASAGGFGFYEVAFLTLAPPDLEEAVGRVIGRGASRVLIVPYFLTLGIHLQRDLPGIVARLESLHPGVEFRVAPPLDGHPSLSGIVADRTRDALAEWDPPNGRHAEPS
jgi:sirohydrochlorin ferrochelatase